MSSTSLSRSNALSGPPLNAAALRDDKKAHLLLAASGSVATIKIPLIIEALSKHRNLSIRLVLTSSAAAFLAGQSAEQPSLEAIASLPNLDGIYLDEDEWKEPWVRGNNILHIELRRWADLLVVAPLSANSLAKMVNGLCDNLLLSTIRAWDTTGTTILRPRKKTIVVAPAMNTAMWNHPITTKQMALLEGDWNVRNNGWVEVLRPIEKRIACGDTGSGGMKEWKEIVVVIEERLELRSG
ncbi:flavoprotein [Phyllosticta capitalensis]|uniref:flavoprotein n=1 Tax=Phyllosticta capitalensis TaxID=121624 RepID=UPI00312EECA4